MKKGVFENNDLTVIAKHVQGFKGFPPMFHTHMEIIYVISGTIDVQIDGITHTLLPGQLSISYPYIIHSYDSAPDAEAIILLFAPAAVQSWKRHLTESKAVTPWTDDAGRYLPLLERITEHCRSGRESLAKDYLSALVGELMLVMPMEPVRRTDLTVTQKALVFCGEHYREEIGIKDVADHLNVSESYVSKIFARKLGCPLCSYLNALRVAEAKNRLKHSKDKIIDIMYDCGFRNQSRFNQVFLQETGMTPRAYRQKHL